MAETQFKYDVFLSHNSKDKAAVEKIARILRDEYQLKVWLDKWILIPGSDSQEDLEKGLNECETIAVFTGETGFGKWENKEMRVAITQHANDESRRVIPVFLPGAPEDAQLPPLLGIHTWVNLRSGIDTKDELYLLYCGIVGKEPGDYSNPDASNTEIWNLKHPYPMPPNFTGRLAERTMLTQWLDGDSENRLFILRALGGFGKSALAWQWLTHDINPKTWKKVVFWSFYEGDASFENFTRETLEYLGIEVPQGSRPKVDKLLNAMQSEKILLIIDGFERVLRLYASLNVAYQGDDEEKALEESQLDCKDINAEWFLRGTCSNPKIKSKVLMTTRHTPGAIKPHGEFMIGCHEIEVAAMRPEDAIEFFYKQGIQGHRAEIEAACKPYGYHPLSLRLLAGLILKDFENPADIVVAQKISFDGPIKSRKRHILEVSFAHLTQTEQKLISLIACFRSTIDLFTLQAVADNKDSLSENLHVLVNRGLLYVNKGNRKFELHPIVRRYIYNLLSKEERVVLHARLYYYFSNLDTPSSIKTLNDLSITIELYFHIAKAGDYDQAANLFYLHLNNPLFYQFSAYGIIIELIQLLLDENSEIKLRSEVLQSVIIIALANAYCENGQQKNALLFFIQHNKISEKNTHKRNLAVGLGNLAIAAQLPTGNLLSAHNNLRNAVLISEEINQNNLRALSHSLLGSVFLYLGKWDDAKIELELALEIFEKNNYLIGISLILTYLCQCELMMLREGSSKTINTSLAEDALKKAHLWAEEKFLFESQYIRASWLLGASFRIAKKLEDSEYYLLQSLSKCRSINAITFEANILLDFARLRYDQYNYEDARLFAEEALIITNRCGYILQRADVSLFLAQYALEQEKDKAKAKAYAEEAKKLATCDGPPYYYKVAYDEAEQLLARLKE